MLGQDFGVSVTYSGTTVVGMVDEQDESTLPGSMVGQVARMRSVLVATGAISPVAGVAITVGGGSYTVYEVREEPPDGRLTRVYLAG